MDMTRRDLIALLGAGAVTPFLPQQRPAVERGAIIRTLLKDIPPDSIDGAILFHEHLSIRYPLTRALAETAGRPITASFTDHVDLMSEETKAAARSEERRVGKEGRGRGPPEE